MGHVQGASDGDPLAGDEESPLLGRRSGRLYGEQASNGRAPQANLVGVDQFDKSRWRSIRVMYLSMFLGAVTFTITMSSLWPFLQVLDPSSKSSFLGWVVASYSLGQLMASPLFGAWANHRKTSKEPLIVSLSLMVLSNLFYTYLQSLPNHKDMYMILARGLIGFSAGNVAVVRSYISGATTVQERTGAMANLSIFQAMGFILGPVIQSILVTVKYPGPVESQAFHFNMYTAPALLAASVALFNLILFLIVFKEYRLSDEDTGSHAHTNGQHAPSQDNMEKSMDAMCQSNSHDKKEYKLDMVAVLSSIYLFFVVLFMFTVFETIGTPLTMHMYGWSKSKATFYQGIFLGTGGCLSIAVFAGTKILAQKYNERYLLLIGFLFCFAGYFSFIPWGHKLPPRSMAPIKNNSHPTAPESILYMLNDIFYKHKHSFDINGNAGTLNNIDGSVLFSLPKNMTDRQSDAKKVRVRSKKNIGSKIDVIATQKIHRNNFTSVHHSYAISYRSTTNQPLTTEMFTKNTTNRTTRNHRSTKTTIAPTSTTKTSITTSGISPTTSDTFPTTSSTSPTTTSGIFPTTSNTSPTTTSGIFPTTSNTSPTTTSGIFPTTSNTSPTTTSGIFPTTSSTSPTTTTTTTPTTTTSGSSTSRPSPNHSNNDTSSPEGCPWQYDWCGHVPAITLFQYIFASFLITVGYPMCNMLTYTIYSKVLGPMPQGLWMGWLTASGSFARTVGPIYVTQIYDSYGPQVTYGSISCFVAVTIAFYLFVFRRLVPFSYTSNPRAPLLFWRNRNRRRL